MGNSVSSEVTSEFSVSVVSSEGMAGELLSLVGLVFSVVVSFSELILSIFKQEDKKVKEREKRRIMDKYFNFFMVIPFLKTYL